MGECWKRRFSTKVGAIRAINQLELTRRARKKHNAKYGGAVLAPYTCPACGGVHIGHRYQSTSSWRRHLTADVTTKEHE